MRAFRGKAGGSAESSVMLSYAVSVLLVFAAAELLMFFPDLPPWLTGVERDIHDPIMLTAIVAPVLYYAFFRPLYRHIRELRQSEREISRQNDLLKRAIESIPSPFYLIDAADYSIKMANRAAVPDGVHEGLTCHAVTHGSSSPCGSRDHPCPLEEVKRTGKPAVFEHVHYDEHGNARRYEVHGYPVMDSGGRVVQMIEHSVDITARKEAENRLRESEERLKDLLDGANDLIQSVAPDGHFRYVNRAWREALGYSEEDLPELTIFDIIHPVSLPHCKLFFRKLFSTGTGGAVEVTLVSKGGKSILVEGHVNTKFEDGRPVSSRAIFRDITERKLAETLLRKEKAFSRELILQSAVATFVIDAGHKVLIWNRACEEMTGVAASAMENTDEHWKAFYGAKRPCLADLIVDGRPEEQLSACYSRHGKSRFVPNGLRAEGWYDNLGGKRRYIIFDAAPILDSDGNLMAAIETLLDQTEQKMFEEKLQIAAATDQLTGIFNRRRFEELLQHEINRTERSGEPFSLIMFDIDHFKRVNDTQGHLSGDQVLKSIAEMVRQNIRKTDYFARWGGEEFILMTIGSDMANSTALAEKLRHVIEDGGFGAAGKVTCSFGVAQFMEGDTVETLTARADGALYVAKESGRNRVETAAF